ncbi:MAG: hypothetical protein AB7N61_14890 [Acidimicrobiia bacterium]
MVSGASSTERGHPEVEGVRRVGEYLADLTIKHRIGTQARLDADVVEVDEGLFA